MIKKSDWIDAKKIPPTDEIFWALTSGRDEMGEPDWEIIKLRYDGTPDYRTLDYASGYSLPDSYNGQDWYDTIFAWLPLDAIEVGDF